MLRPRSVLPALLVLAVLPTSCDPEATTMTTTPEPSGSPDSSGIDPLVPFSPSPTPFRETTSGYAGDTLTLPTADGGTIHVSLDNTALPKELGPDDRRPFSVYFTVTNAGDTTWAGTVGEGAKVTDANGGVNQAEPLPKPRDLHPDPESFGVSNTSLFEPVILEPGESVQGVLMFITGGGNRQITVSVTLDGGATQGTWATSMGPS